MYVPRLYLILYFIRQHRFCFACNFPGRLQTLLFYPSGDLRKSPTTCRKPTEVSGRLPQPAGNLRRSTEVPRNLQETSGERRKSYATLRETNCNCRKSPAICRKQNAAAGSLAQLCGKQNAVAGSLPQLSGNQMQLQEVSRNLRETKCSFQWCCLASVMVSLFFFCRICTVLPSPKPSASSHFPLSRISGTVMR